MDVWAKYFRGRKEEAAFPDLSGVVTGPGRVYVNVLVGGSNLLFTASELRRRLSGNEALRWLESEVL